MSTRGEAVEMTHRHQRGIALVLVSLLGTGLLIMAAVAGDVGLVLHRRTRMQVAADAGALAGAAAIRAGKGAALAAAIDLVAQNGFAIDPAAITLDGNRLTVKFERPQGLVLGQILTERSVLVPAEATAEWFVRSYGLRPFGLPVTGLVEGLTYTLKQDPTQVQAGNFQALDFDGSGARGYSDAILYGTRNSYRVGEMVATEPGNMAGPTRTAVNEVIGSGNPRIVVPVISSRMYFDARGKSLVRIDGFAAFDLIAVDGKSRVTARFVGPIAEQEMAGSVFGSRLIH